MKKFGSILLIVSLMVSLTACSSESLKNKTGGTKTIQSKKTKKTARKDAEEKILVIYFSAANTISDDVDSISSATPNVGNLGSTEQFATYIHDVVGGDLVKIIPKKQYPLGYDDVAEQAKVEKDDDERPEFEELGVNPEDYDTIFIGYPIWWYTLPMVMNTFFDQFDFSGKTIIPFNTHAGSGDGGTYDEIVELEPKADVVYGLDISGEGVKDSKDDVEEWLVELGY